MIGEIPDHIGSRLGEESSASTPVVEEQINDSSTDVNGVTPFSETPDDKAQKPTTPKSRVRKVPKKRVKKASPKQEAKQKSPTASDPQQDNPTHKEDHNQTLDAEPPASKLDEDSDPKMAPDISVPEASPSKTSSYREELKEIEKKSKLERQQYLNDLSRETMDFLKKIRADRKEWLKNFRNND